MLPCTEESPPRSLRFDEKVEKVAGVLKTVEGDAFQVAVGSAIQPATALPSGSALTDLTVHERT